MIEGLLQGLESLLLLAFGGGALLGALAMICWRPPMRVAMALIWTMVCLGAVYGLLGVHFIAAFQVLIYVGAVMVFMVYVIMLLDSRDEAGPAFAKWLWPGLAGFALLLVAIVGSVWPALRAGGPGAGSAAGTGFGIAPFSAAFLGEYWLLFELSSVLLLAAVVAALAVIRVGRRAERAAQAEREAARATLLAPGHGPLHLQARLQSHPQPQPQAAAQALAQSHPQAPASAAEAARHG